MKQKNILLSVAAALGIVLLPEAHDTIAASADAITPAPVASVAQTFERAAAGGIEEPAAPARNVAAADDLEETLLSQAEGLKPEVLHLALNAAAHAAKRGLVERENLLTVIDYSIRSSKPRLFVFDLDERKLLFRELVAHGKNSGDDRTTSFSNSDGSLQSSMGVFVTAGTYVGGNGYSLRLRGLERGVNDHAMERMIVVHGAPYVSQSTIDSLGRLGRSWGCPAVRPAIARKLIDTIRGGSVVFSYYPDDEWLSASAFLPHGAEQIASAGSASSVAAR